MTNYHIGLRGSTCERMDLWNVMVFDSLPMRTSLHTCLVPGAPLCDCRCTFKVSNNMVKVLRWLV